MKKLALAAFSILLLLAVVGPRCLAAENSANDQQPTFKYSKLPPVQLPSTLYAQKIKSQPPSFFLLQRPKQAEKEKTLDWIGITTAIGTIISSIAAIITAIAVPLITLDISKKTMKQTAVALEKDFKRRKIEQEISFKFQRDQILFEEKKKLILNFYVSTSQPVFLARGFDVRDLEAQLSALEMIMDTDFYLKAKQLSNLITDICNRDISLRRVYFNSDNRNQKHDPTLTASK